MGRKKMALAGHPRPCKTRPKWPPASKDRLFAHGQSSLYRKCTANSDHLSTKTTSTVCICTKGWSFWRGFTVHEQPGAVEVVLWRHWKHVTQVHSVISENQLPCTMAYVRLQCTAFRMGLVESFHHLSSCRSFDASQVKTYHSKHIFQNCTATLRSVLQQGKVPHHTQGKLSSQGALTRGKNKEKSSKASCRHDRNKEKVN